MGLKNGMGRSFVSLHLLTGLLLALLSSCSRQNDAAMIMPTQRQARQFSLDDKRAARALSISNDSAIATASTPYAQALLCSTVIESLEVRFQQSGTLSEQQKRMMRAVKEIYEHRLRSAGGQTKSDSEIRRDLQRSAADNADIGANARTAIACVRSLQR